jgi:hypothetical protein
MGFGLPNWDTLISRAFVHARAKFPSGRDARAAADNLFVEVCGRSFPLFNNHVRAALYETYDSSLQAMRASDLLSAIGVILMLSRKCGRAEVISYNYDDVVETYLQYHAYDISAQDSVPEWSSGSDGVVYHPHGYLPMRDTKSPSERIVLAPIHYDEFTTNEISSRWDPILLNIMRSNTCLFIGLSGDCPNLRRLLQAAAVSHAGLKNNHCYWGVRFTKSDALDDEREIWEHRNVYQRTVEEWSEVPEFLFQICQTARNQIHG